MAVVKAQSHKVVSEQKKVKTLKKPLAGSREEKNGERCRRKQKTKTE